MEKALKGIILCGGKGTRMLPATRLMNKHVIPVLNVPMVVYPLQTLVEMGIKDILIVSGGEHIGDLAAFLGDGSEYGVNLTYKVQKEAGGIAQALLLAEDFVYDKFAVILGDNFFEDAPTDAPPSGWGLVLTKVANPKRFGVFHEWRIEEKPEKPKSDKAVAGLYFYRKAVFDFIKTLSPSARGEMEITDVNNWCLKNQNMYVNEYSGFWSDMGTPESLLKTMLFLNEK